MAPLARMSVALAVCLVMPAVIGFLWDKPPSSNTHDDIVQLENQWLEAEDKPKALPSILADDFVHVVPAGLITKDEQIRYLTTHRNGKEQGKHFENLRVRMFGNVAIANGIVVASAENGKIQKTLFTDVFAYRNGRWQAVNAQETPLADSPENK